jgi:Flp pilus assembly protein TadB
MLPEVISALAVSLSAVDVLKKILDQDLAEKNVRVESTEREALAAEVRQKAELIRGSESPEEASRSTRETVERQVKVLEEEKQRLVPIAAREHWVALFFAIAAGIVLIVAIVLAIVSTVAQAIVTLVASSAPGFLSKVFFARETRIEEQIKEISEDLRESERLASGLHCWSRLLKSFPLNRARHSSTNIRRGCSRREQRITTHLRSLSQEIFHCCEG